MLVNIPVSAQGQRGLEWDVCKDWVISFCLLCPYNHVITQFTNTMRCELNRSPSVFIIIIFVFRNAGHIYKAHVSMDERALIGNGAWLCRRRLAMLTDDGEIFQIHGCLA